VAHCPMSIQCILSWQERTCFTHLLLILFFYLFPSLKALVLTCMFLARFGYRGYIVFFGFTPDHVSIKTKLASVSAFRSRIIFVLLRLRVSILIQLCLHATPNLLQYMQHAKILNRNKSCSVVFLLSV
jgi:hypothetical protein